MVSWLDSETMPVGTTVGVDIAIHKLRRSESMDTVSIHSNDIVLLHSHMSI